MIDLSLFPSNGKKPEHKSLVINLFAGPGSGKSTTAAGLFFLMKLANFKCELVTEYAKDLVYEDRSLADGIMIFAQQHKRMKRLEGKVDYIVTDAPLIMSNVYQSHISPKFNELVEDMYNKFNNINVFVRRVKPYQAYGRVQTEEKAMSLDKDIYMLMGGKFDLEVLGNDEAPKKIMELLHRRTLYEGQSVAHSQA